MEMWLKNSAVLLCIVILASCASAQKRSHKEGLVIDNDGVAEVDPFYQVPSGQDQTHDENGRYQNQDGPTVSNTSPSRNNTVLALLGQAKMEERAGKPERAASVIERALRIDPKNAELWHRLALLRLQQGQYALAESLAAKSNALSNRDAKLQKQNETLIRQTKILRGQ